MESKPLNPATTAESVPYWRVPKVLLDAAVRSSSLLGHDLIHRFTVERFQLFLAGYFAMYFGAGVVLSAMAIPVFSAIRLVSGHRRDMHRAMSRAGGRAGLGASR